MVESKLALPQEAEQLDFPIFWIVLEGECISVVSLEDFFYVHPFVEGHILGPSVDYGDKRLTVTREQLFI